MKILKSIGGVFVAIWRWIKNTAWVQPLLIVGAIFGVIFSIPSITNGIKGLINSKNSAETFYSNYQLSLEGGETSDAEKFIMRYGSTSEDITKNPPKESETKYFLFFTKKGDSNANACKEAFEIARDNWRSSFTIKDSRDFKLYTIFTDEKTDQTTAEKSAFAQFIDRQSWFFEEAAGNGLNTPYHINGKVTKEQLEKLQNAEDNTFPIPTLLLVDWTNAAEKKEKNQLLGVREVTFSLTGDNNWDKARFLVDCWNGDGDFAHK